MAHERTAIISTSPIHTFVCMFKFVYVQPQTGAICCAPTGIKYLPLTARTSAEPSPRKTYRIRRSLSVCCGRLHIWWNRIRMQISPRAKVAPWVHFSVDVKADASGTQRGSGGSGCYCHVSNWTGGGLCVEVLLAVCMHSNVCLNITSAHKCTPLAQFPESAAQSSVCDQMWKQFCVCVCVVRKWRSTFCWLITQNAQWFRDELTGRFITSTVWALIDCAANHVTVSYDRTYHQGCLFTDLGIRQWKLLTNAENVSC